MRPILIAGLLSLCPAALFAALPQGTLYATRTGQVLALRDLNNDGDFLDFGEASTHADSLPSGVTSIAHHDNHLYVINPAAAQVLVLQDLNVDGDALDFGEVLPYAQIPTAAPTGITALNDGSLLLTETNCGCLYRVRDNNADGDALDFNEVLAIATGLTAPLSVSARPDGKLLVAQNSTPIPVRILHDRDADGDYLDFAENISYAENFSSGTRIIAQSTSLSHLLRPTDGRLLRLHDWTSDDDALDFAEVLEYATGFTNAAAMTGAADGHFIADGGASGIIRLVMDENGDGDALDFAEVILVAEGVTQCQSLVFVPITTPGCIPGDANYDGQTTLADLPLFVNILLTKSNPSDSCPIDTNNDGALDARDIKGLIEALLD